MSKLPPPKLPLTQKDQELIRALGQPHTVSTLQVLGELGDKLVMRKVKPIRDALADVSRAIAEAVPKLGKLAPLRHFVEGGYILVGLLRIRAGFTSLISGTVTLKKGELIILSVKEKTILVILTIINTFTVLSGIAGLMPSNWGQASYFLTMFTSDLMRSSTVSSAPYLFLEPEKRAQIAKILRIFGGYTRRLEKGKIAIGDNVILESNMLSDAIQKVPLLGKSVFEFITKIIVISTLVGDIPHTPQTNTETVKSRGVQQEESRFTITYSPRRKYQPEILYPNEKPLGLEQGKEEPLQLTYVEDEE